MVQEFEDNLKQKEKNNILDNNIEEEKSNKLVSHKGKKTDNNILTK